MAHAWRTQQRREIERIEFKRKRLVWLSNITSVDERVCGSSHIDTLAELAPPAKLTKDELKAELGLDDTTCSYS